MGVKVLVVDDAALIRRRLAAMFAAVPGVEAVLEAADTRDALGALRAHAPDVVILDLHMPGENGLEFAPKVKHELPSALVVVVTNQATETHRVRCLAAGADAFFDKSRDFDAVVRVVSEAAAARRPPMGGR